MSAPETASVVPVSSLASRHPPFFLKLWRVHRLPALINRDQHIDPAEPLACNFNHPFGGRQVPDIARNDRDIATRRVNLICGFFQYRLPASVKDYGGTRRAERACGVSADARTGARDQYDFVLKTHDSCFLS